MTDMVAESSRRPRKTGRSRAKTASSIARSLTDATYEHVLDLILSRRLPGNTIIQERRMAEELGVSRTPMREALGRLEGEGLIVRHGPRTLAVRLVSLEEFLQSLELRLLIEPHAASVSALHIPDDRLAELRRSLRSIDPRQDHPPAMHWVFDDNLHGAVGEYCKNDLTANTLLAMRRLTKMFERQHLPERTAPGWKEHDEILSALETRDGARARRAMAEHLKTARKNVLEIILGGARL
ncbi:GntR family transcriptional regulator [Nguyenibacter vanlangensis]|uniref:GntR family transcriptional regulator n=1 Tax=Nguyenibacter vanlangensis TaxID=1216886 RepID=A0A7Y7M610_9PROT|nr:GntR family transcriptional regulator [Nguyenibacter vanlangensis]NVN11587.1 GntR family transcriptional regulator [Nguyenibacter vanlangensis]